MSRILYTVDYLKMKLFRAMVTTESLTTKMIGNNVLHGWSVRPFPMNCVEFKRSVKVVRADITKWEIFRKPRNSSYAVGHSYRRTRNHRRRLSALTSDDLWRTRSFWSSHKVQAIVMRQVSHTQQPSQLTNNTNTRSDRPTHHCH